MNINDKHKLITLDIKGLYVNIQINETIQITEHFLQHNNSDKSLKHRILHTLHIILHQKTSSFSKNSINCPKVLLYVLQYQV